MYIREKANSSGSVSIQVIQKIRGSYKVVKTVGCATTQQKIDELKLLARQEVEKIERNTKLFCFETDEAVEQTIELLSNSAIRTIGAELIFGRIYDYIGFSEIKENLFRHLVISRLAFPLSKLKTAEYLYRYQGVSIDIDSVYRFLDKLNDRLKIQVDISVIATQPFQ